MLEFQTRKLSAVANAFVLAANSLALGYEDLLYKEMERKDANENLHGRDEKSLRSEDVLVSIEKRIAELKSRQPALLAKHRANLDTLTDFELLSNPLFLNYYLLAQYETQAYYLAFDANNANLIMEPGFVARHRSEGGEWRDSTGKRNPQAVAEHFLYYSNRYSYVEYARVELNQVLYGNWFKAFTAREYESIAFQCEANLDAIRGYELETSAYNRQFEANIVEFVLKYGSEPIVTS